MNKIIRGSVAGAAGIALLMGGYGTFALWSDSANMAAGSVTSGVLDIEAGAVVWDDANTPTAADWDPSSDLLVPGDVITMTQTFDITATGTNLAGTLTFDAGTFDTGAFGANLTRALDVQTTPGLTVDGTDPNLWTFSAPLGVQTGAVTATVTYTFDSATSGQTAQGATATLSGASFTIAQTTP